MKNINPDPLGVPVYLKTEDFEWPENQKLFYLMTADGLMLCRNHAWFKSCAPVKKGPGELDEQKPFCSLSYPKIPRVLMEKAVGFFTRIYDKKHWESALILVYNQVEQKIELLCPDQKADWGTVKYNTEEEFAKLPAGKYLMIGDMHSHGSMSPNPSTMDTDDELNRPGLHIVVGYINDEPPDFYCAAVVDGVRFEVKDIGKVLEGYDERIEEEDVPKEWIAKVKKHEYTYTGGGGYHGGGGTSYICGSKQTDSDLDKHDLDQCAKVLARYGKLKHCPTMMEVRQSLFTETKHVTYLHCERKAEQFIEDWGKEKHESPSVQK